MLNVCNHNIILPKYFEKVKKKGVPYRCPRMGGRDKGNTSWRRISQPARHRFAQAIAGGSEIRKIAAAKKRGRGGNSFSPHPFFFPPRPSGKVFCSAALRAAIKIQNLDFRQKRFGFCPKGTAIFQSWSFGRLLPRPRFARARQKPRFYTDF